MKAKKAGVIWQQDGCSIHGTPDNLNILDANFDEDFLYTSWPAKSPDLNIIENIWGIMQVRLDAMQLTHGEPRDRGELETRVKQVWNAISLETIRKLYQSVPKRLDEVITNTGGPTDN